MVVATPGQLQVEGQTIMGLLYCSDHITVCFDFYLCGLTLVKESVVPNTAPVVGRVLYR